MTIFQRLATLSVAIMVPSSALFAQSAGDDGETVESSPLAERLNEEAFDRLLAASPYAMGLKQIVIGSRLLWPIGSVSVCFVDGDTQLHRRVMAAAEEWNALGSPVKLNFDAAPRSCAAFPQSELHVGFSSPIAGGHRATVGTSRRHVKPNIEFSMLQSVLEAEFSYFVRHEFGHALGLLHEIRHAQANCWDQIDKRELYKYYAKTYGSTNTAAIDAEVKTFLPEQITGTTVTPPDMTSVMMYNLPPEVFFQRASAPCYAPLNSSVSPRDIAALKKAYDDRTLALAKIVSLSTTLTVEDRSVVNALLAYELAPPATRRAADAALADDAASLTATALSNSVFALTQRLDR